MAKVHYTMTGTANGHPVKIAGTGSVARSGVRLALSTVDAPMTFDRHLAWLVGLDALLASTMGLCKSDDPLHVRARADLLGEGGVPVGTILACACLLPLPETWRCTVELELAQVAFEIEESLTAIGERTITATALPGGLALQTACTVSTSRGRELHALLTTWLQGAEPTSQGTLTLAPAALDGDRIAVTLS